ncbi:MAG: hypothetical protein J6K14_06415 [Clostridia bacterium]|nr:hypothetical protein [Clostridia bacterium]
MMKKIISLVLVVCFLFSCFVVSTSAEVSNIIPETEEDLILSQNTSESAYDTIKNVSETLDNTKYFYVAPNYKTHYTKGDALSFRLNLNSFSEYDRSKTFFSSTENIILNDYSPKEYSQSEDLKNLNVSFDINPVIISKAPLLNFKEVSFEKIYATTKVYAGEKIVDSEFTQLSVLPTVHGVFVSEFGDIYAYDQYISYLYSNELITDAEYKLAAKKATELTEVEETKPTIGVINQPKLRVYNEKTNSIELKADYTLQEISAISGETRENASELEVNNSIMTPSVAISRTIEAMDSGQRLRIYGNVSWIDIEGNWHPARDVKVEIFDENAISDTSLATMYTLLDGSYSATLYNQLDILENGYDIYIKITTKNDNFEIATDWVDSLFSEGYFFTTATMSNVTGSHAQANYAEYSSDTAKSMSIHQAFVVGYHYYETMNNYATDHTVAYFPANPSPIFGDVSYAITITNTIYIIASDYCDWDVIIHELGHQAAAHINVDALFSGSHYLLENLSERYGKQFGVQGGWNEGWASYFSMAAQLYYNDNVAIISNIPYVADNMYTDLDGISLPITNENDIDYTITSAQSGFTDGNEYAVTAVLLYLVLNSGMNLGHQTVWDICKQSEASNFSDFMETLYSSVDKRLHSRIGEYLERHNICDEPTFGTALFSRTQPGTFSWTAAAVRDNIDRNDDEGNFNAYIYYNQLKLTFYDEDLNIILQTQNIDSSTEEITLTNDQWATLTNAIGVGEPFYWGIATYQNDSPVTGPYYSSIKKYHFLEDFPSIPSLNTGYTYTLDEGDSHFYKFDAPETGDYVFFSEGDTDVRLTYYDSYQFNYPCTDDDSGTGLNFMYRRNVSSSTTVYLVVDSPTSDSGQYKIAVSKIADLTTAQSGNLSGTAGNWYQFTAPYTGTYHFVSPNDSGAYGELFSYPTTDGSIANRLAYNGTPIGNYSFKLTYALTEGQIVYLRVRGQSNSSNSSFKVAYSLTLSELDTPKTARLERSLYFIYEFTAPYAGNFTFYTEGWTNTYADVFNEMVYDRSITTGRIAYDDNSGDQDNCSVTCALSAGQVIYVRIKGSSVATSGMFDILVIGE